VVPTRRPPPGRRSGTGRGVRERRLRRCNVNSRLTGAPTRRLKVSIPRFFSREGAPVVVPEGWRRRPPGRSGPFPAQARMPGGPRPARAPLPPHVIQAVSSTPPRGKGWEEYKGVWEGVDEEGGKFFRDCPVFIRTEAGAELGPRALFDRIKSQQYRHPSAGWGPLRRSNLHRPRGCQPSLA
jgi:hypothetical protein